MFSIDDINVVVHACAPTGAELIGEMQYGDTYRLAYIRGPEGIIVALASSSAKASLASKQARGGIHSLAYNKALDASAAISDLGPTLSPEFIWFPLHG